MMTKFVGDIAITLELITIALGLVTFYFSQKDKSIFLKSAAYLLLIGGVVLASCTGYYHLKNFFRGEYKTSVSSHSSFHRSGHRLDRRGGRKLFKKFHHRKDANNHDDQTERDHLKQKSNLKDKADEN